jgi:hypothetical protein
MKSKIKIMAKKFYEFFFLQNFSKNRRKQIFCQKILKKINKSEKICFLNIPKTHFS